VEVSGLHSSKLTQRLRNDVYNNCSLSVAKIIEKLRSKYQGLKWRGSVYVHLSPINSPINLPVPVQIRKVL